MGEPLLSCPRCGGTWEQQVRFCPLDGAPLDPAAPPDPRLGTLLLGQFELCERIGGGSMGTVYRAWQRPLERPVAVKVLRRELLRDPQVVKRFYREARAVARLAHPSIVTVFLVGECEDGAPYIVMELCGGPSLAQVVASEVRLPVARAVRIAGQIARALAEAHAAGVVHRDLKPENIVLAPGRGGDELVKVLDFGIAKILVGNGESQLTGTGTIFGTPHYLAPEQASGGVVDARADLYSLGVILYQMVTGRLPFEGSTGMQVVLAHLQQTPAWPRALVPELPVELDALVRCAMARDPAERFASADDMGAALGALAVDDVALSGAEPSGLAEAGSFAAMRRGGLRSLLWAPLCALLGAGAVLAHFALQARQGAAAPVPSDQPVAAATVVPTAASSVPPPPATSTSGGELRLTEEGYTFKVTPPPVPRAYAALAFLVEAVDPAQHPLRAARLDLWVRGLDRSRPAERFALREVAPGRYSGTVLFRQSGSHHLHLEAQTHQAERLQVWFDLPVGPGTAPAQAAAPARGRSNAPAPAHGTQPAPAPSPPRAELSAPLVPHHDGEDATLPPAPSSDPPVDETPPPEPPPGLSRPAESTPDAGTVAAPPAPRPVIRPPSPLRPPLRYAPGRPWDRWRRVLPPPVIVPPPPYRP
jgi:serine/threonine-protein kinase